MILAFDEFELDLHKIELRRSGEPVHVEPQVFDVLAHLVRNRDRVVPRIELLDTVWGTRFVTDSALSSRIKSVRRALGDDGRTQRLVRTVHGRGFRFVGDVAERQGQGTRRRVSYARSSGWSVAYQVFGDGAAPVVFVPGFVSNIDEQWEIPEAAAFLDRMGTFGRVLVFDKRGTGLSDRSALNRLPTLEERMDDIVAVMDAAGFGRASLFGISEGGPLSLLFSAIHPERVDRLVLYGSYAGNPFGSGDRATELAAGAEQVWGTGGSMAFLGPSLAGTRRRAFARYERNSATPEAAATLIALADRIDVRPLLGAISRPTLVLHRRGDEVFPLDCARELAAGIPGARLSMLEGTDHLWFAGETAPLLDELERFLVAGPEHPPGTRKVVTVACVSGGGAAPTMRFDGPVRALRAASAAVAEGTASSAAVHTGEVALDGSEVAGDARATAEAVAAMAAPGEVWTTATVVDLCAGAGLAFVPRGSLPPEGGRSRLALFALERP